MDDIFFYDRDRNPMIRWFDFSLDERRSFRHLRFKMEINISIFSVKTEYDIDIKRVLKLRNELKQMHDQEIKYVRFCLLDGFTNLEFFEDECGVIRVDIYLEDKPHSGNLELSYPFDQSFLPELIRSFDEVLDILS